MSSRNAALTQMSGASGRVMSNLARRARRPPVPALTYSDAGSRYTSLKLAEHLALQDIRPSVGSVGDAYDNALMETINGLFEAECIRTTVFHDAPYKTLVDVEYASAGWVDWYNNRRLHSTLDMATPVDTSRLTTLLSPESRKPT